MTSRKLEIDWETSLKTGIVVHIDFVDETDRDVINAIDKLIHYFKNTPRSRRSLYIFSSKLQGNVFAFFQRVEKTEHSKVDAFKRRLKHLLCKSNVKSGAYDIVVEPSSNHKSFHYWLAYVIGKSNYQAKYLTAFIDRIDENEKEDVHINDMFNFSPTYHEDLKHDRLNIKYTPMRLELNCLWREQLKKTKKIMKNQPSKPIIEESKIKELIDSKFTITDDNNNFVSKKVICDLLDIDYKDQRVIRTTTYVLQGYGVYYNRSKMIKGVIGAYQGITLNP